MESIYKGTKIRSSLKLNILMWYVYIVEASDTSLYTGITTNPDRRLHEHNTDNRRGSKYLRMRRPVKIRYTEKHKTRSEASKREYEIKNLLKKDKEKLISGFQMK